ncbi:hypothetical protein Y1Q_0021537 [Alligator mississippiensis]|uniref:Uncharacterized protein n=1 Tax=Alligator mississippiensis TaxID=8496 RepID=A0A151P9Y9_ALLMI|nr:hypothetical protein Y1Q_0021537 [Alligator mississippiensis]
MASEGECQGWMSSHSQLAKSGLCFGSPIPATLLVPSGILPALHLSSFRAPTRTLCFKTGALQEEGGKYD